MHQISSKSAAVCNRELKVGRQTSCTPGLVNAKTTDSNKRLSLPDIPSFIACRCCNELRALRN